MRVLVTGATGFIGRRLVPRLLEEGHEVVALVRRTSNTEGLPESVEFREAELLDIDTIEPHTGDADAVVHLAAYFDFYPSDEELMFRVNVDGTRNLMNACVGTSVERFIYCSTTETIGPVEHPPGDEETELRPSFEYGRSKVMAEEAVREISADTGLKHIILRPTGVLGEGDFYTAFELIKALNDGEVRFMVGDGEKHIMYTHIDDVVDGFVKALTSDRALDETIILCPDAPMRYYDLIHYICSLLGVEPPRRKVPVLLAKLGVALMSPIKNRGRTTFLWHVKSIEAMDTERWYTNAKAKELLDWSPKLSMQEGIARAVDWYFEHGHLEKRD